MPPSWTEDPSRLGELEALQMGLADRADRETPWRPPHVEALAVGAVFVSMATGKPDREVARGDPAWAVAVARRQGRTVATAEARGRLGAAYHPGYLALQVGPLLEEAAGRLDPPPDVLLVDATGRDHPRRAGLALHLGAALGVPTVGVTDRPLVAAPAGDPERRRWSAVPLLLRGEPVGYVVRSRRGVHPIVVHAAWRTDPDTALAVVRASTHEGARTPEPLRSARRLARIARARDEGRLAR